MWRTRTGNRTLQGAEARLVAAAIVAVLDNLALDLEGDDQVPQWQFGIAVFDELEAPQRLAVLNRIAVYLLSETLDTLPLTAVNEAAIGALFAEIHDAVMLEIGFADETEESLGGEGRISHETFSAADTRWRQLVLEAFRESQSATETIEDQASGLAPLDCQQRDPEQWENVIEWLADGILWDRDYEIADCFLDAAPDKAQHRKLLLGIDDEYFTAIAPDPLPDEVPRLLSETQLLARRYPR